MHSTLQSLAKLWNIVTETRYYQVPNNIHAVFNQKERYLEIIAFIWKNFPGTKAITVTVRQSIIDTIHVPVKLQFLVKL